MLRQAQMYGGLNGNLPPVALLPGLPLQIAQTVHWQGQFPPPEAVERFEKVLPGSFDRMIKMAEQLQTSQIEEAKRAQNYMLQDTRRGHWLGFSIAALAIVGACVAAYLDHPWLAAVFLGVPITGVAKSLIESVRDRTPPDPFQNPAPKAASNEQASPEDAD